MHPLFTIGHCNHPWATFLELLRCHGVERVADVRSQPFSRRCPWFSRATLEPALRAAGIGYVFLGRELGARREERECYVGNAVSFERVEVAPAFLTGLRWLKEGLRHHRIALLCAEKEPLDCHRALLVARHAAAFADVAHFLADGSLEAHAESEQRLMRRYHLEDPDLFCPPQERLAQAYARRSAEIAWVQVREENL